MATDYIMRMIQQFVQGLVSIIQYRKAGEYQQALEEIRNASEKYLNHDISFFLQFTSESLLDNFKDKSGEIDLEDSIICADLIYELALISQSQNCTNESYTLKLMCLNLYLNAIPQDSQFQTSVYMQKVDEILGEINQQILSKTMLHALHYYRAFQVNMEKERIVSDGQIN